ncbi:PREDICTED: putative fatty acyl-CoA reductase CG5065 [Nicrophorus vespilloides]|uniref:Fatty acyl-CoA reductase n=1 Tax=Nicrophorus vespilloides TaxID=110193 RepID=A0ABM1NA44_NICVS|nr:PREDICTED: putative fatty acyl-CoA reductase CG5065 [Nicrophorus vespilloides]XP_017783694.1 PREDICTED: putative fatty acyl-CoA reductase CG5065 [Nicrophorus vespilloides]XP_017783695.1 PREDICTED: putative fatty acyl-CoA reductase CG5065 [Nicrophorus vespilloides]
MGITTATKPMELLDANGNEMINRNHVLHDSLIAVPEISNNIGEFYRDAKIFMTGGTGFVGKVLLEKLLRSCDLIDSIYLLVRSKRGMAIDQRLKELFKSPLFNKIKDKDENLLNKVKVVEGDVSLPNLGLSQADITDLEMNVNIVFHSAATVRFNENLRDAVVLNTMGTQRVMELCTRMTNLKSVVHVSTAYSNADKKEIDEIVYKPPFDPYSIINCVENLPQEALDLLAEKLLNKHPNTYTFTKAMAEYLVMDYSAQLPVCIVRPSIVTGAWREPIPGWVDNVSGVTGIMMEIGRGSIKSIIANESLTMDLIPVDIVANSLLTAAWHTVANRSNVMRVYNCTSGNINSILWKDFGTLTTKFALEYPTKYLSWYPGFSYRTNRVMHWICAALFQTIPACIFDIILYCTKHKPIMYTISKKFERACKAGEFCSLNEWDFKVENLRQLHSDVNRAEDGENFNVDMSKENGFTWEKYTHDFMLGIRQYVLKDDLSSLPHAKTKLNRFYWANRAIQLISMYALLKLSIL